MEAWGIAQGGCWEVPARQQRDQTIIPGMHIMSKSFLIVAAAVAVAALIVVSTLKDSIRAVQTETSPIGDVGMPVIIDDCGDQLHMLCEVTEAAV